MKFTAVQGKFNKNFVKISDIVTKKDFEMMESIKKTLTRSEYMPFIQSSNKTITFCYLLEEVFFPSNFWHDVKTNLSFIDSNIILENEEILLNNDIDEDYFYEWVKTLKFPDDIDTTSETYHYQREAVYLALLHKTGRIEVAMSGGKTFISYLYFRYIIDHNLVDKNKKILVIVPSKSLCTQLQSDYEGFNTFFDNKIIVETMFSGSKKVANANVVCGTFSSLGNYDDEYFDDFAVVVCDELHRAKANTIRNEIFAKLKYAQYMFGMTGTTPPYKTLDYLHITLMFGGELLKRTVTDNIRDGVSTPVNINAIIIDYDEHKDYSINLIQNNVVGSEKYHAEKRFFQNYEPRTNILARLMTKKIQNTLILVDTVEYCNIIKRFLETRLDSMWTIEIIHGNVNNRDEIIYDMRNTIDYYCLIGTMATVSTGISIKNLENIYFMDGGKSMYRVRQSLGRGMRLFPTKQYCNVYDFQDNMLRCAFKSHAAERNKIYKGEGLPIKFVRVTI